MVYEEKDILLILYNRQAVGRPATRWTGDMRTMIQERIAIIMNKGKFTGAKLSPYAELD